MSRFSWAILLVGLAVFCVSCAQPPEAKLSREDTSHARFTVQKPIFESTSNPTEATANAEMRTNADAAIYVETMRLGVLEGAVVPRSYTGVVRATRTSELGFKRTGRVEKLHVSHGQVVQKGDVLAELDTAALTANLAVIEAQRKASDARLRELIAGPRKQTIDAARAQVAELEANREQLRILFERNKRLIGSEVISQQNFDDARLQFSAIEKKLSAQKFVVAELEEGTRAEQIDAQRAEIAQLEATMKTLHIELDESKLVAPFDAIISRRLMDEGTIVAPGVPLFRIVERMEPEAWIGVPPEVTSGITADREYQLAIGPRTYTGKLKYILPELDNGTRTQTVVLSLVEFSATTEETRLPASFALGQIVHLKMSQDVTQAGYWLPLKALTRGVRGLWSAFVIEEKIGRDGAVECFVRRNDVEIIQIDSDRVLVRGTLNPGDRVVTTGIQKLTTGQRVRLFDASSAQSQRTESDEQR